MRAGGALLLPFDVGRPLPEHRPLQGGMTGHRVADGVGTAITVGQVPMRGLRHALTSRGTSLLRRRARIETKAISTNATRCSFVRSTMVVQSPVAAAPAERTLHDPGDFAGDEHPVAAAGDRLDRDAERLPGFGEALAAIAEIADRRLLEAAAGEPAQDRDDVFGVMHVGRRSIDCQRDAVRLDRDVDLHAADLLAAVHAPREAARGRGACPAVDHHRARLWRIAAGQPPRAAQPIEQRRHSPGRVQRANSVYSVPKGMPES